MRLNEVVFNEARPIEGYATDGFRVGGEVIRGHVLCGPAGVSLWDGFDDAEGLERLGGSVDVLFVGTGGALRHLPKEFAARLENAGVPVEIMPTPAACRTYNVLLSEGRRIALAALTVEPDAVA